MKAIATGVVLVGLSAALVAQHGRELQTAAPGYDGKGLVRYDEGTLLDGTFKRTVKYNRGPTGRIKFGTESNGSYRNITISNCVFDYSRGLAIESVDGALIEDVAISNLTCATS